ncbi:MAG: hypothetical protein IJY24_04515 [Clostridia bacterium]|nr:hypothetical protein [Clostridia bacterium]
MRRLIANALYLQTHHSPLKRSTFSHRRRLICFPSLMDIEPHLKTPHPPLKRSPFSPRRGASMYKRFQAFSSERRWQTRNEADG